MLRVCIASIQNVERSLLLLVVSASGIPLRTIKFFSVRFSSAYWSMLQAVTNKHSLVRRRLCDLHCMVVGNCVCHFVVRTSSNRSIASGAWPTVSYNLPDNLPDEASPGDWLGLRSQADLNSPINDSSLCSLFKWFLKMFSDDEQTMSLYSASSSVNVFGTSHVQQSSIASY